MERALGERIAAVEEQAEMFDRELLRVRSRLHEIESDRATIRLLLEQVKSLGLRIGEVAESMERVAQRAAEKTVALAFADQNKIGEFRIANRRDKVKTWAAALTVGVAAGGFVTSLIVILTGGTP